MIDNRSKTTVDANGYVFANGIRIARYLHSDRALEFVEPRTGNHRGKDRRRVIVKLADLTDIVIQI